MLSLVPPLARLSNTYNSYVVEPHSLFLSTQHGRKDADFPNCQQCSILDSPATGQLGGRSVVRFVYLRAIITNRMPLRVAFAK